MIIKLNGNYRLSSDAYNWVIQKEGHNDWVSLTYWSTLEGALAEVRGRGFAAGAEMDPVDEAALSLRAAKAQIARVLPAASGACDRDSFRREMLPSLPNDEQALVIERGPHEWWVQFDWVRRRPKDGNLPIVWQYVLGRPEMKRRGNGEIESHLKQPQYFRCLGAALTAYLDRRLREGDSTADAAEIGQLALAAAALALKPLSSDERQPDGAHIDAGVGAEYQPAPQGA